MTSNQVPPGRTSISRTVFVKPLGPHHFATCVGSVHAANTRLRGASTTRVAVISRFDRSIVVSFFPAIAWFLFWNSFRFALAIVEAPASSASWESFEGPCKGRSGPERPERPEWRLISRKVLGVFL